MKSLEQLISYTFVWQKHLLKIHKWAQVRFTKNLRSELKVFHAHQTLNNPRFLEYHPS